VWASTIGAVLGPNLMAPAGLFATSFGLPKLTGPYILAFVMLMLGATNIWIRLKPDPYLTHLDITHGTHGARPEKIPARQVLAYVSRIPNALLGLLAIAIGHVSMVSIMVMTPVHMAHVDVSLKIIGIVISVHVAGMYALSPLVGRLSDRIGRIKVIQLGVILLLLAGIIAGSSYPSNSVQLGIGLFLLGLGWSCTLIAGSTLLTESIADDVRASVQGTSDTVMNLSGAIGGALAGVIIATTSYGWLCTLASLPVVALGLFATKRAVAA
jgi:MFS family permease